MDLFLGIKHTWPWSLVTSTWPLVAQAQPSLQRTSVAISGRQWSSVVRVSVVDSLGYLWEDQRLDEEPNESEICVSV